MTNDKSRRGKAIDMKRPRKGEWGETANGRGGVCRQQTSATRLICPRLTQAPFVVSPKTRITRPDADTPRHRHAQTPTRPFAHSPIRPFAHSPTRPFASLNYACPNRKLYAVQLRKAGQLFAAS